jgi:hypothetical protein
MLKLLAWTGEGYEKWVWVFYPGCYLLLQLSQTVLT